MNLSSKVKQLLNEVSEVSTIKSIGPLSTQELIRGIRLSIASEQEAIKLYEQLSEGCKESQVKQILDSVTKEEKIHIGEFLKALEILDPDEIKDYDKGGGENK
jgi:rubrerythrin